MLIGFAVVFLAGGFGIVTRPHRGLPRRAHRPLSDAVGRHPSRASRPAHRPDHDRRARAEHELADLRAGLQRMDGVRPDGTRHRPVGEGAALRRGGRDDRLQTETGDVQAHPPEPHVALLTLAVLEFARIMLAEATLSFLGLGLQFPEVSLGVMANSGRDAFFSLPRLAIIPGVAITLIVLAVNFLASWLRVASDPIEREKRYAAGSTSSAASTHALTGESVMEAVTTGARGRPPAGRLRHPPRHGARRPRRELHDRQGRDARARRRVRVRQERHRPGVARDDRVARPDRRWRCALEGRRRSSTTSGRDDRTGPRAGDRDGLPGPDDLARPGVLDWQPDGRGDPATPQVEPQDAPGREPSNCSTSSASPTRRSASSSTRSRCQAGCANACSSPWPWRASRSCSSPTSRRPRSM